ncbi:MAG: glycosyltransferase family 4 protein [Candidatus Helarchaeota archaeon]
MRICRIYNNISIPPEGFGIGLYELSLAQQKLKNEIFLITRNISSKKIKNYKYDNISFNFIPYFPKIINFNNIFPYGLLSAFRLNQLIHSNLIDLIHIHDVDAFVPILLKEKKIPLIQTFHVDKQAQMQREGYQNIPLKVKLIENLQINLNYTIWKKASAIICISKQTMERLLNYYKVPPPKVHYIPNGVNTEKFNPNLDPSNIKHSLNITQNYPIILFIGRIYPLKGLKELISALVQIKKQYPKLVLLVVGKIFSKSYYQEILKLIKNNHLHKTIKFIGNVSYNIIPYLYRAADIFLLPSYSEGMPKVILEAMASRLCIITTNIEGNRDLIKHEENGLLIKPKSSFEIIQNLIKVIDDKKFREKLAYTAWKVAQQYDWQIIAKKVQEIYKITLQH